MIRRPLHAAALLIAAPLLLAAPPAGAVLTGAWVAEGEAENANFGEAVGPAGDVNGDGYSDTFVGAPGGAGGLGTLAVYHGGPGGLGAAPAWTVVGNADGTGGNAACAGDINSDGYDDLLVGAALHTNGQTFEGKVTLFLGGPAGLAATPAWTLESDSTLARLCTVTGAGDFNGDGYGDFVVGAPGWNGDRGRIWLYLGAASGVPSLGPFTMIGQPGDRLGSSLSSGDVDGDGLCDLLTGAPGDGYFTWTLGSTTNAVVTLYYFGPNGAQGEFGASIAGAGDVDLDGYCDVVVGAPKDSISDWQEGAIYYYRGDPGGLGGPPDWTFHSQVAGAQLGFRVACAGDINGDGRPDLAAGAPFLANGNVFEGRGYAFYGSANGYDGVTPVWIAEGEQDHATFALAIDGAGDVNGDGFADLIAASSSYDDPLPNEGRAAVWHGGADMPAFQAAFTEQNQELAEYGSALALGDFNADGYDEYVAATGKYLLGAPPQESGAVWIFPGQPGLASTTPTVFLTWPNGANHFGADVAGLHDVNGDGFDDLLVGAPGTNTGAGAAHLFLGAAGGIGPTPAWTGGVAGARQFGFAVACAGDVNGDGFTDALVGAPNTAGGAANQGAAYLYLGGPGGLDAAPVWSELGPVGGALFGWDVAGLGDVDGDGFGEIAIGAPGYPAAGNTGRVFVYFGAAGGIAPGAPWQGGGVSGSSETGFALAGGDFNGDGLADLLIGAPGWDGGLADQGWVEVHLSSGGTLQDAPAWTRLGAQAGGRLGHAVAAADFDLDGKDEIIVGQPFVENGQVEEGQVLIFGVESADLLWGADGNAPLAWQGRALAGRGDVNGDGFPDLLSGLPGLENPHVHEGAAELWLGNGGRPGRFFDILPGADRRLRLRSPDDAMALALLGGLDAAQVRLRARSRTPMGRGRVALELEVKRVGLPFDGAGTVVTPFADSGAPGGGGSFVEQATLFAGLSADTGYHWRARVLSPDPRAKRSPWFTDAGNAAGELDFRTRSLVAVAEPPLDALDAGSVVFFAPRPQPFAETSTLAFTLARAAEVRVAIYDVTGRRLVQLESGRRAAGLHELSWRGADAEGRRLPSGVYFAVVDALGERHARRLVLTR